MSDIFISYAREDRETAQRLAKALEAQGWSVWWDTRLRAGEAFDNVIARELDAARCVVVLWSQASIQSHWVLVEAGEGLKRQVLVPIRIEDVESPLAFRRVHAGDLIDWKGRSAYSGFKQLMADVASIIGPPPSPPPQVDRDGEKAANFRKSSWPKWLGHFVAALKQYGAGLAGHRPRKWHVAMAAGLALLVLGGISYSLYQLPHSPNQPGPGDKPPKVQEATCYDRETVDSLIKGLEKARENYDKRRIDVYNYNDIRHSFVNQLNSKFAQGHTTEECISQSLKILRFLYDNRAIDVYEYNESRRILWKNLHDLLLSNAQTDDQTDHALGIIRNLYDKRLIDVFEFNESQEAISQKVIQRLD